MDDDKIERLRLVTRGYELSASGSIPPSQYLKYLEHIRWRTISTSQKLPLRQFWAMGVVRSQTLEVYEYVGFDEELELSMWMSRLGRTSMSFSHDIVRTRDGDVVAKSAATIVALDDARRPAAIKDGAAAYLLEREALAVERLDGDVPAFASESPVHVRPSDHDLQQHVNHARYADFVEDARLLSARAGVYGKGTWDGTVRRFTVEYSHELRTGDAVAARTWRTPGRERSLDFALVKDGALVATRARVEVRP